MFATRLDCNGRELVLDRVLVCGIVNVTADSFSDGGEFLDPQRAIERPRWLLGRTWGLASDSLKLESRFDASTIAELRSLGHEVETIGAWDEAVGHAGMVIREANGVMVGGYDPRSNGAVAAY